MNYDNLFDNIHEEFNPFDSLQRRKFEWSWRTLSEASP